jgi:hypothetical protein
LSCSEALGNISFFCFQTDNFFHLLYLQLPGKLNEADADDNLPLDLALQGCLEGIAQTLVKYRVDLNMADHTKRRLIHKAISRGKLIPLRHLSPSAVLDCHILLHKLTTAGLVGSFYHTFSIFKQLLTEVVLVNTVVTFIALELLSIIVTSIYL